MIDETKLQGNVIEILSLLRKQTQCCRIVSTFWATSSVAGSVFVTVNETGGIQVYDQPGGNQLFDYGTLTP